MMNTKKLNQRQRKTNTDGKKDRGEKIRTGPFRPWLNFCLYREPLKTSVFRGFLTLWRKLHLCNSLYNKELAIFSAASLETQPEFPEMPYILVMVMALLFFSCAAKESAVKESVPEDAPIITSATYQHTLYNGRSQPIEARAAKDDVPPFIITYFNSEDALLKNEGGSREVPSEVGDYYVRIERPSGNGYREGPAVKVEYHIQKALVVLGAEDRQEFVYDGTPKSAAVSIDAPVELGISYYAANAGSNNVSEGRGAALSGPPVNRGHYRVLVSFAGNAQYMGASKEIELVIR
jgi:hypothetical protein